MSGAVPLLAFTCHGVDKENYFFYLLLNYCYQHCLLLFLWEPSLYCVASFSVLSGADTGRLGLMSSEVIGSVTSSFPLRVRV
jgi:hypothetical protein